VNEVLHNIPDLPQPFARLPDWLHLLDSEGYELSGERQYNIGRWLLAQIKAGKISDDDSSGWLTSIAPLVCSTPEQQIKYQKLLKMWLQPTDTPSTAHEVAGSGVDAPLTDPLPKWWQSIFLWMAGALLLLAFVVWFMTALGVNRDWCVSVKMPTAVCDIQFGSPEDPDVKGPTDKGGVTRPDLPPVPPATGWQRVSQPLIAESRDLAAIESIAQPAVNSLLKYFLAIAPIALALAGSLWLRKRRRDVFNRLGKDDDGDSQRKALNFATRGGFFEADATSTALRELNQPVVVEGGYGDIDVAVSMEDSVRTGRTVLRRSPILRLPEVVILVQVGSASDLRIELARRLCRQLIKNGLRASNYRYAVNPTWLVADGATAGQVCSPAQLRQRHPHARLLLLCDPAQVYALQSDSLRDWANSLAMWQAPLALLTLEAFGRQLKERLSKDGLQLLPLSMNGLALLPRRSPTYTHTHTHNVPLLPANLRQHDWPDENQIANARFEQLKEFLQPDGMRLLSALALYPELHFGLALALDIELFADADHGGRQRRLSRLLRLPWARHGWLPDSLRYQLIFSQDATQRSVASGAFKNIFKRISSSGGLRLSYYEADVWDDLRLLFRLRGPGKQDAVFLSQVVGPGWLNRLAFKLPRLGQSLAAVGLHAKVLTAALLLISGLIGLWLWHNPLSGLGGTARTMPLQVNFITYTDYSTLADPVRQWLSGRGAEILDVFKAEQTTTAGEEADLERADTPKLPVGIQLHTTPGREGLIRQIAEDLRRMPGSIPVHVQLDGSNADGVDVVIGLPDESADVNNQPLLIYRDTLVTDNKGDNTRPTEIPLPRMIPIRAGSFQMGSPESEPDRDTDEGPLHPVQIAAFELAETEVTFEQYDVFAKATKRSPPDDEGWGRGTRPAINVSWQDAQDYIAWLNRVTGSNYRLPSEAEWEYAARAGTQSPFYTGSCIYADQANYNYDFEYNDCGVNQTTKTFNQNHTLPVGSFNRNPYELLDMAGNVWEWTQDCWHDTYEGAPQNGEAWLESDGGACDLRVVRGGGWNNIPVFLRSAVRDGFQRDGRGSNLGFRLARTVSPSEL